MRTLRQTIAVTAMSLRGIPSRLGASMVLIIGIAGVVAVLICVFALADGFAETAAKTGRADRALVLGRGALTESAGSLPRESAQTVLNRAEIKKDGSSSPIASFDALAFVRLTDRRTGLDSFATLRGMGPRFQLLRPELQLVSGRPYHPGLHEVIVGRAVQQHLQGLELGRRVALTPGTDWTVVGVFTSHADSHESELLTDAETLLTAFERNTFNSATVLLNDSQSFGAFKAALLSDPSLSVDVKSEQEYFTEAARPLAKLLQGIAYVIGGIMAFGAVFAALNAMYSAVAKRTREVAILRAIGYDPTAVVASVFIEVLLLAACGALLGATLAWLFFNGSAVSTNSGATPGSITYYLHITPRLMAAGMACACGVGLVGGLFPALRAATLPVASVIKGR